MFEPVPSLLPTTKRLAIQTRWQPDCSSEMQIPLTALSDNDKLSPSSSRKPSNAHLKKQSVFDLPWRAAEKHLGPRFTGWRFGVLNFAFWASIVLFVNIAATVSGFTVSPIARGVFFDGDCDRVKRLNTWLHLAINVLSTIVLAGSNYTMQCLSAPTRSEIDAAHSRKPSVYLDVGILSVRNLSYISERRTFLWVLLALSSLPLHLLYNSAVFSSISTNSYYAFSVGEAFLKDEHCTNCLETPTYGNDPSEVTSTLEGLWSKARSGRLERLDSSKCIDEYAISIQTNRRNLLLVSEDDELSSPTNNTFMKGSHAYWATKFETYDWFTPKKGSLTFEWICSQLDHGRTPCSASIENLKKQNSWQVGEYCNGLNNCKPFGATVKYCLSERAEPHCKLHFEPSIAIVVTVLNFFKAALMFYVAFGIKDEPLMAMGDAVASFLDKEDNETKNMCMSSMANFRNSKGYKAGPQQYSGERYRWKDATSKLRVCVTLIMFLLALAVVGHLLRVGIDNLPTGATLQQFAFGGVDPRTTINYRPTDLISNALTANTPQLILSFLYFGYNSLFTAMLMGYEWVTYSHKRKGLRVTHLPSGAQRSTYFLQLPYRFGIPLMVLSFTLHWLVSQSIFLVAIDLYDVNGNPGVGSRSVLDFKTLGYSPLAIIAVLALGGLMVISMVAFGYIPYRRAAAQDIAFTLACDHYITEKYIKASAMCWIILRDVSYIDSMGSRVGTDSVVRGPISSGRVSIVAHEDVARIAAAVLAGPYQHVEVSYVAIGSNVMAPIFSVFESVTGCAAMTLAKYLTANP
ncbi:hypothetical protein ACET3X_009407 [Alternaria dauci]|uniref:DUF6536 domain-containing protein n=1 Tax=Alternaria dauci TaxID=48095 RepID=A0ABR3U8S2_9PLEO